MHKWGKTDICIEIEMDTKNIAISDEAYQMLKALKKPGESFTDVIERMTRKSSVLELAGLPCEGEVAVVEGRVKEVRKRSSR
jgi:predicted CopG family antitoxin